MEDIQQTVEVPVAPIGEAQAQEFTRILQRYKAGKAATEARILASENWWKLRNTTEESKTTDIAKSGFRAASAWTHNVVASKHADAIEAFPEPNILPREEADQPEAKILSDIVPCVLEQNNFEQTYSDAAYQKNKTGTGAYKVIWDSDKLNGLGEISVARVNLLNVYWEPGITDIQQSRYFFSTELRDNDLLQEQYPKLKDKLKGNSFVSSKFLYDDTVDTTEKSTVIEVYYHRYSGPRKVLHYCKYVGDTVLFATENEPEMAHRGLYDHGKYPYVFDALFPIEGSPCGYGYIDLCRNPQTAIDLLQTAIIKNSMVGAVPRYFARTDGAVNPEEFLDLNNPIVKTNGNLGEDSLRPIDYNPLNGNYMEVLTSLVQEMRETTGNTETSTGSTSSGVTAASAIAALQEASGKGSRDATKSAYRAYTKIVEMCIELIRQFYTMPRKFRIIGETGAMEFVTYSNQGLQPQLLGNYNGQDAYRLPVFDIKVSAQKANVYTKVAQNELALQFFQMGFFNPQMTDQALMCLDIMDFDGKDSIRQKVAKNGTLQDKLMQYMQLSLTLAERVDPAAAEAIGQDIMMSMGGAPAGADPSAGLPQSDAIAGIQPKEHSRVRNARESANEASQPGGGRAVAQKEGK